ncbi:MAG: hemerythrin domain-containing protein [Alphaproteobacteria bacterium]|nr:hemerythrin domain-containing protein [Alphaproteobacteria bacterium]MBU6473660.1 hemerythrin domain-containing protein [Alphaproteobacteria bacterium]MDE2011364.1 hemerythrin domain-containing protein [Alphaproteobacteria bacterium]MDE2072884.1 hemerythrin domain-containing protein [Alphaproteobacteria bacterium]MDE2353304.1 hemerythrin domain-containing protein [Alphaproteobacteria bacterium]
MAGIHEYMSRHHELCDGIFGRAKKAATGNDWAGTERDCKAFLQQINQHIDAEENLLFPAFEDKTGMTGGPTQVMRMEHAQLRELFEEMLAAIGGKEADRYLRNADLVAALLHEHNMKEENILYPMLDNLLGAEAAGLLAQVEDMLA